MSLSKFPTKEVLTVILGGLFGWMLGHLSDQIVYGVMAIGIIFLLVVVMKKK